MCTWVGGVLNIKISHGKGLSHMVLTSICSYRKDKHPCTYDVLAFLVAAFQILCTAVKQQKSNPASAVDLPSALAVATQAQNSGLCSACVRFQN